MPVLQAHSDLKKPWANYIPPTAEQQAASREKKLARRRKMKVNAELARRAAERGEKALARENDPDHNEIMAYANQVEKDELELQKTLLVEEKAAHEESVDEGIKEAADATEKRREDAKRTQALSNATARRESEAKVNKDRMAKAREAKAAKAEKSK